MSPMFIAAVVDTLLPGDSGGSDGYPPLPPASAAGIDLTGIATSHSAVFNAVAQRTGKAEAFVSAVESERIAAMQSVERAMPEAFRVLLSALLADYYQSPPVLNAMGWRADPPQPQGHAMPEISDAAFQRLGRVQARGKLWRR
jgi:hypothetical protein